MPHTEGGGSHLDRVPYYGSLSHYLVPPHDVLNSDPGGRYSNSQVSLFSISRPQILFPIPSPIEINHPLDNRSLVLSCSYGEITMASRKPITYEIDENGCWICTSHKVPKSSKSYPSTSINGKQINISHIIYRETIGPVPVGIILRHTCDNPLCINPAHLLPGNHADNMKDRSERNRQAKGEHNAASRLNKDQVRFIRSSDEPVKALAERFGVHPGTIYRVLNGVNWGHIS